MLSKNTVYTGLILCLLGLAFPSIGFAQDPIYTQFYVPGLYLNPALAGYDGGVNFYSLHRRQWWGVRNGESKFNTTSVGLSFFNPVLRSGFGVSYNENVEGEGRLKWKNVGAAYSYQIPLAGKTNKRLNIVNGDIRLGLNLSYNWRDLNWENLVFVADLDPLLGLVGGTPFPVPYAETGSRYLDVDAGFAFRHIFILRKKIKNQVANNSGQPATNQSSTNQNTKSARTRGKKIVLRLGLAAHHITRPDQSLFPGTEQSKLAVRWTLHGSTIINSLYATRNASKRFQVAPAFKIDVQPMGDKENPYNPFPENAYYMAIDYGVNFAASGAWGRGGIYGGLWHRNRKVLPDQFNTNSVVFLVGTEISPKGSDTYYKLGISYDYNVTGLGESTGGAIELSFSIVFPPGGDISSVFSGGTCPALR